MACLYYIEPAERRKTLSNQPTNQRNIERDSIQLYLTGQVPRFLHVLFLGERGVLV